VRQILSPMFSGSTLLFLYQLIWQRAISSASKLASLKVHLEAYWRQEKLLTLRFIVIICLYTI